MCGSVVAVFPVNIYGSQIGMFLLEDSIAAQVGIAGISTWIIDYGYTMLGMEKINIIFIIINIIIIIHLRRVLV